MIKVCIVTVSDRCWSGAREDLSGPTIRSLLSPADYDVLDCQIVPDEEEVIAEKIQELSRICDLVLTTGGTGLAPRDVTPEATLRVIDRLVPGLPELMRAEGQKMTSRAVLSREVAGISGKTLIVNLPGSPRGAGESLTIILPVLKHAVEVMKGEAS